MLIRASDLELYKFPMGRCAFALKNVAARARAVGATQIAKLATLGADEAMKTMDMEMRLLAGYDSQFPPRTKAMDNLVDRCLGGVAAFLESQIRIYPDEPRGEAAARIMQALFPEGVGAITHLPYTEEHSRVSSLLERAQAPDLAADVRLLPELLPLLERLRERNNEYGALLASAQDIPSREQVRESQNRCHDYVFEVVGLIFGLYALDAPDKTEERDHLLAPILNQNEALRANRRRRRTPVDVNPDTGEELPEEPGTDDAGADDAAAAADQSDAEKPKEPVS